jgi:hypothetical protein
MLVPENVADGIFLGHIPAEQFHRRLQIGVRESVDGFFQVCVGGLQRFLQSLRLDDRCSAPAAPARTRAGKRSHEQAVLRHDQVEDVATERTPSPGFQSYFPAMTRARPANLSDSVPASLDTCLLGRDRLRGLRAHRDRARNRSRSNRSHRHLLFPAGAPPLFMTENPQFHSFIIITMILTARHDSAIRGRRFREYFWRGSLVR